MDRALVISIRDSTSRVLELIREKNKLEKDFKDKKIKRFDYIRRMNKLTDDIFREKDFLFRVNKRDIYKSNARRLGAVEYDRLDSEEDEKIIQMSIKSIGCINRLDDYQKKYKETWIQIQKEKDKREFPRNKSTINEVHNRLGKYRLSVYKSINIINKREESDLRIFYLAHRILTKFKNNKDYMEDVLKLLAVILTPTQLIYITIFYGCDTVYLHDLGDNLFGSIADGLVKAIKKIEMVFDNCQIKYNKFAIDFSKVLQYCIGIYDSIDCESIVRDYDSYTKVSEFDNLFPRIYEKTDINSRYNPRYIVSDKKYEKIRTQEQLLALDIFSFIKIPDYVEDKRDYVVKVWNVIANEFIKKYKKLAIDEFDSNERLRLPYDYKRR